MKTWLRTLLARLSSHPPQPVRRLTRPWLLESLEDRTVPSITSTITLINNSGFNLTTAGESFDNDAHDLTTRPSVIPNGTTASWQVGGGSGFLGGPVGVIGTSTWNIGNTGLQDTLNLDFPLVGVNHASHSLTNNSTNYFNATEFHSGNDPTFTLGVNAPNANLGVWGNVTPTLPGSDGAMNMLLLPDGTVMIHGAGNSSPNGASPNWYLLSPNSTPGSLTSGSYAVTNNSITTLAAMTTGRRFFASEVLPNDTVFVYGGENINTTPGQVEANSGEYFTLGQSSTTAWGTIPAIPTTAGFLPSNQFGDQATELLSGNRILSTDPGDGIAGNNSFIFNVPSSVPTNQNDASGTWTATASTAATASLNTTGDNEDNWLLLPNGDVLDYEVRLSDANVSASGQLYVPAGGAIPANDIAANGGVATSVGQWVNASTGLIQLTSSGLGNGDLGPGVLLPFYAPFNGPAGMYFGASGSTAFYNPADNTWTSSTTNVFDAEPTYNIPGGANNVQLGSQDGPAAVLPDGEVLVALSPPGTGGAYPGPTRLYLFNPNLTTGASASAFTDVTAPDSTLASTANPANSPGNCYHESMLVLPTAQILMSDNTNTLWLYTPTGTTATPLPGTQPTITSITINPATGLPQITGTNLNGPTEGAYYGDDQEMSSNYPLVQLTDLAGNITYATSSNWQTGIVGAGDPTVDFALPAGKTLADYATVTVSAEGLLSASVPALTSPNVMAPPDQSSAEGASQVFHLGSFIDPIGAPWSVDVNWGDGTPDTTFTAAIAGSLGTQSHTYAEEGHYTPKVTVTDTTNNLSGSASFQVSVSDPAVLATGGFLVNAVEGAGSGSQTVATFTDPGGPEAVGNYSADIDWGDGTGTQAGAGTISFSGGVFTVKGRHTYAEEGGDTITVTIHHEAATDVQTTSTATVSDPAVTPTGGFSFSAVEGALSASQTVATFTDPGGAEPNASDPDPDLTHHYTATIDWGDGTPTSAGTITFDSGTGVFTVSAAHLYGEEGMYTVTVTIHHETAPDAQTTSTATVSDPAVIPTGGFHLVTARGAPLCVVTVATFTDPGGAEPNASDPDPDLTHHYTATIDWGDGTPTSAGEISFSGGVFTVTGDHAYVGNGTYTVTVTIHHETAPDAQTTSTAKVSSVAIGQGPCDPDTLLIGGTQAGDTIVVSPVGNTGGVKVQINNEPAVIVPAGTFSSIAVYGQDGDDDIQITGSIKYSAFLFGQGGNDRLKGGKGNNLLVGGAGDDTLTGDNSGGFSVLIGGTGSDRLVGNGGSDLLIAGAVDFEDPLNCDNNPLLCDLLHTWAVPTQSYATRAAAVGTLLAGHVANDHAADTLTGSSGQDLFYISVDDKITGKKSNEIVVIV